MCGIAGWVGSALSARADSPRRLIREMTDTLRHRGPDDSGIHVEEGLALGHRRLSIIDLDHGQQPMWNEAGTVGVVYNGEIYNFLELRRALERDGHRFRTRSDTEVLLAMYERHGDEMLERLDGMFAFALWDRPRRRLLAARDRAGEKPLYYAPSADGLVFGSELKALVRHPAVSREIDPRALASYLAHEYVPAPASIFRDVRKLPAAHAMSVAADGSLRVFKYWEPRYGERHVRVGLPEATARLSELLERSLRTRLIADVPLGVFLSGGVDSSSIVGFLVRRLGRTDVKTFSIGFREASFDESRWARTIAERFGTEHHEEILDANRMLEVLPELLELLDEPFADPSIVPTYLLSRFTRRHVKVALGGDGGDELFVGYPTFTAHKLVHVYDRLVPRPAHRLLELAASRMAVSHRNMSFDFLLNVFLRGAYRADHHRHIVWLGAFSPEMQRELWSYDGMPPDDEELFAGALAAVRECGGEDHLQRAFNLYFRLYLQDDILTKVDRASMMNSLEVRAPFLDVELMETAQGLPSALKFPRFRLKHVLKETVRGLVPDEVIDRPKKGFGIPVGRWLRNELREELLAALSPQRIRAGGFFSPEYVQGLVHEHLEGRANHRKPLWTLLMFERWRERWAS